MLKAYFTASTLFSQELSKNYRRIISLLRKHRLKILSGEQLVDEKLLDLDKKLSPKEIFKRQKSLIEESDFLVAEVTKPSHGVGGEIVYGLVKEKPVLGLLYENTQDLISPMILGNPSENFYLERYDLDKVPFIVSDFVKFVRARKSRKGKLIVIDGSDGSGKTLQSHLLIDYLKKRRYPVKYFDFPQYYKTFHGQTVAKFLRGEFGKIDEVSPYLASLAYALDRVSVKNEMEYFLNKGGIIICNRYATSSLAHQGAKFLVKKKREEFLKWLYDLEYKTHKIPKEDLVVYLNVPWKKTLQLSRKKNNRDYLQGKKDIAEADLVHRQRSEQMYLELCQRNRHWVKITCVDKENNLLAPETIHEKIIVLLKTRKII
ncbi:MAG: hypothetical protein NZL96_02980 [Patescibacteria group bacterium]|nr:hypothetical protein [Patescibacteria group bacterium]